MVLAEPSRLAAVVLAGGTGARLGGVDKASIEVRGSSLLERVLAAVAASDPVVVVGHRVPTSRAVLWTLEDPPLGGPAAGLLAGLDRLGEAPAARLVAVLAVDLPRVTAATVERLVRALDAGPEHGPADGSGSPTLDGAVLLDPSGRRQTLAAVYRQAALLAAAPDDHAQRHGLPMRRLVRDLRLVEVPALRDEARDVDTAEDLRAVGGRAAPGPNPG